MRIYFLISVLWFTVFQCLPAHSESTNNLALKAKVSSNVSGGNLHFLTDGQFVGEGASWDHPGSVITKDRSAEFIIDLQTQVGLRALIVQADWNDSYVISASDDGIQWREVWTAPLATWGQGLRRRHVVLPVAISGHFLKINAAVNDGVLSLSEFQAYEQVPPNWDELTLKGMVNSPMLWWDFLTIPHVEQLRALIAGLVLMLICWRLGVGGSGETTEPETARSGVRKMLVILTLLAGAGWCNFFVFHWGSLIHRHDVFHYYLGAKYSPEIGYTRLYECAVTADQEDVGKEIRSTRMIRNLETNTIESIAPVIANPEKCKSHFSPERWAKFKRDLNWFRISFSGDEYAKVLKDHGYNATPVWNLLGYLISNTGPATTRQMNMIGLLDPVIMTIAFLFCLQQFGLWAGCMAIVYFGTNYIASFAWTGGAFLRLDWLFYVVLGICFLKKAKLFPAGFCLVMAGLVRIFPFAFLAGLLGKILLESIRYKSLAPVKRYRQLYLGSLTALLIAVPLATAVTGMGNWKGFVDNTSKHFGTLSTNMMGLAIVVGYSPGTRTLVMQNDKLADPFETWKTAKKGLLGRRKLLMWACEFLILALMGLALLQAEDWEAAVLGMGLIFLIRLSNYDYFFALPLAFYWVKERRAGLGLVMIAWLSWLLPRLFERLDDQYFWATLMYLGLYVAITWQITDPLTVLKRLRRPASR